MSRGQRQQSAIDPERHFIIEPCGTCSIPGYLIVRPRRAYKSLSHMSPAALTALGPTLAMATQAIEAVVRPERVYCVLFSEQTRSVHFHLFPRTAWLTAEYRAANPGSSSISGPRLMDWARHVFQRPIRGRDVGKVFSRIQKITGCLITEPRP